MHSGLWRETGRLLKQHGWTFTLLVLGLCTPIYALYVWAVLGFDVKPDVADKGIGIIMGVAMPLINGGVVWCCVRSERGEPSAALAALRAAAGYWSRLLTVYIGVSLILLGFLAVTVLPAYALMMILKIQQPLFLVPFGAVGVLWCLPRYALVDALVVVEGLSPYYARHRSAELIKPRRWQVVALGMAVYAVPLALELGGEYLPDFLGLGDPASPLNLAVSIPLNALSTLAYIVPVVFFYAYYRRVVAAPGGAPTL